MTFAETQSDAVALSAAPSHDPLLTIKEVLERLRISRSALHAWVLNRAFPAPMKLGGRNRWRLSQVVAKLEAMESEAAIKRPEPPQLLAARLQRPRKSGRPRKSI